MEVGDLNLRFIAHAGAAGLEMREVSRDPAGPFSRLAVVIFSVGLPGQAKCVNTAGGSLHIVPKCSCLSMLFVRCCSRLLPKNR